MEMKGTTTKKQHVRDTNTQMKRACESTTCSRASGIHATHLSLQQFHDALPLQRCLRWAFPAAAHLLRHVLELQLSVIAGRLRELQRSLIVRPASASRWSRSLTLRAPFRSSGTKYGTLTRVGKKRTSGQLIGARASTAVRFSPLDDPWRNVRTYP